MVDKSLEAKPKAGPVGQPTSLYVRTIPAYRVTTDFALLLYILRTEYG